MASECCVSLTKYFLFLFNLIFFILGSVLLSLGLWMTFSEASFFLPPSFISIYLFSYLLILSGSVTMSLGFLGCLGSVKTVKCLLGAYFLLLTVLLAAQIVGGVLLYTQKSELNGSLHGHILQVIKSYGRNDSSLQGFEETLDYIQTEARCCGWEGQGDWEEDIPCSCYYLVNTTVNATNESQASEICFSCFSNATLSNHKCAIYNEGCSESINRWLSENILFILVVLLTIVVVEICGMILSMSLYKESSVDYSGVLS